MDDASELHTLLAPLREKYRGQYGLHPPTGCAIVIDVDHWVGWAASSPA